MQSKTGLVSITLVMWIMAGALAMAEPSTAPLNPDFVAHRQARAQSQTPAPLTDAAHGLGFVPPPLKLPAGVACQPLAGRGRALPTSYDLRNYNKVTPVKDQGNEGACWSFATYGSLESCLKPGETWDFSENNMVNLHGFDWGFSDGGNQNISAAYLTRWTGPVLETEDPYPRPGQSPTTLAPRKHVQQVIFLPAAQGATGSKTAIKQAVMDYGAVYTSMRVVNGYLNTATAAYYYNGGGAPNHAVTIIGWDDGYSRNNFAITPNGDGAFIVKNSWGTSWGNQGYFYASYYDTVFASDNAVFMNAEPTTNYNRIYSYDPLGWVTSFGYNNSVCWGANIFTAAATESLRAVSVYAAVAGTQYEVYIYTGVTAGAPRSGTLRSTKTGTLATAGYHTIALNTAAALTAGQRFSVVIKLTTPGYEWPMPMEYAMSGYSSQASAAPGQSFFSDAGTTWTDLTSYDSTANFCIKAFAGTGSEPPPPPPGGDTVINDFDGDGKSDYALFRYTSAHWFIWSSRTQNYLANGAQFGGYGWLPVPGDFNGGGKADAMLYSRWYGNWAAYFTETGATRSLNWGGGEFIPVAGDFDGDGQSDYALYGANSGAWYILGSTAGWLAAGHQFGGAGWLPFLGDYAGDGRNQITLYNEASGDWYFFSFRTGQIGVMREWGGPGFMPVPGDFDGDGLTDFALYGHTSGKWFIWASSAQGWLAYDWTYGGAGYLPVIGDYDGGGRDDVAVYSMGTYYWGRYLMESNESAIFQWGGPGCAPIVPWWLYWYYGI